MSTQQLMRMRATVEEGGRIAISLPTLPAGAAIEILLLVPAQALPVLATGRAAERAHPVPETAADVELYLEAERGAWEH